MKKSLLSLGLCVFMIAGFSSVHAQTDKNKKSRYYQNNTTAPEEFDIQGFQLDPEKKEVEKKTEETEYDVKVRKNESDSKFYDEKKVVKEEEVIDNEARIEREKRKEARRIKRADAYPTTYGTYRNYDENRNKYDKYYHGRTNPSLVAAEEQAPPPPPPPPPPPSAPAKTGLFKKKKKQVEEREIGMTPNELEYKTTVVKKRYTNLDVLCDDLDLSKHQRPVFKGICSECSADVDKIITDKNLSSLEKNYNLKQCYMMRDKRLRETLDDDQYRKFLRVKDADEYLIITKDLELKDGVNR